MSISTISTALPRQFYGVFTALGLTDNFYTFDIFKNASYPCAHQFVVINKKNANQGKISKKGSNAISLCFRQRYYLFFRRTQINTYFRNNFAEQADFSILAVYAANKSSRRKDRDENNSLRRVRHRIAR